MKGVFKILSVVILFLALVGSLSLVQKNLGWRIGATQSDTYSMILPANVATILGQNFNVQVWLSSSKDVDKLAGAELLVKFDATKLKYIGFEPQNGYVVLNDNVEDGNGILTFKMVTMGEEKGGAVNILKLTFQPLTNTGGSIVVQQGKMMVTGQSGLWDVMMDIPSNFQGPSTVTPTCMNNGSTWCENHGGIALTVPYDVGDWSQCLSWCNQNMDSTKPLCQYNADGPRNCWVNKPPSGGIAACNWKPGVPPYGSCLNMALANAKVVQAVPTIAGQCGNRCVNNAGCSGGMTCAPIWWPCDVLPIAVGVKLQANMTLTKQVIKDLKKVCPKIEKVLINGTQVGNGVKMPTFYGVCRNNACVSTSSCKCP